MSARRRVIASLLVLACTAPSAARAQDAQAIARARALFEDGKRLLESKDYAKACPMLAESSRLTAAPGPLLALAMCHEGEGKTASAWSEYHEVVARTRLQGQADWAERARRAAASLEPRLSKLQVAPDAEYGPGPALVVKLDGHALGPDAFGVPTPVDPGVHVIEAASPGHQPWSMQVLAVDAATLSIVVPPAAQIPEASGPRRGRLLRAGGIATGSAGIVAVALGTYFVVQAASKNSDSTADCAGDSCGAAGRQARLDAISDANVATAAFIAGGVLIAGGTTLFVVGVRAGQLTLTASAVGSAGLTGLVLRGTF